MSGVAGFALVALASSGCASGATVPVTLSSASGSFRDEEMVTEEPSWGTSTDANAGNVGEAVCSSVSLSGQQLTVKDSSGKIVGVVTLGKPDAQNINGTLIANSAYATGEYWGRVARLATATCVTTATVDIAGASEFYSVTVSAVPGQLQYEAEELNSGISLNY